MLTDASGDIAYAASYDPYGVPFEQYVDLSTQLGFTGEYTDPTGLLFLRARYANPADGAFLSRDPFEGVMQRAMSRNGYSYVEGNPVNLRDPSGRIAAGAILVPGVAVAAAVAAAAVGALAVGGTLLLIDYLRRQAQVQPDVDTGQKENDVCDPDKDTVEDDKLPAPFRNWRQHPNERFGVPPVPAPHPGPNPAPNPQPNPDPTRDEDNRVVVRFVHEADYQLLQAGILHIFNLQVFATTPHYLLARETANPGYLTPDTIADDLGNQPERAEYFVAFYRRGLDNIPGIVISRDDIKEINWRTYRLQPPMDEAINISTSIINTGKTVDQMSAAYLISLIALEQ